MKRNLKCIITMVLTLAVFSSILPSVSLSAKAAQPDEDTKWQELQTILSGVTGRYTEPPDKSQVEGNTFSAGMLLGNGSFGVVADARPDEQSFYFSGQDVWNNSQKVMNAQLQITGLEAGSLQVSTNESNTADGSKGAAAVIDGDPATYWITKAQSASKGDKWLKFDFQRKVTIDSWSSIHRGYVDGHNTRYNTRDFSLQTSEDGVEWKDVDIITDNTDYIVERNLVQPVTSRYFRVNITKPVQPGQETHKVTGDRATARISEVDFLYNGKSLIHAENKEEQSFTYSASDTSGFTISAENAFDSDENTMWRSNTQAARVDGATVPHDKWVKVSSDKPFTFNKIEVKHNGVLYPQDSCYNTHNYELQISDNGTDWSTIKSVSGNTENINTFEFDTEVTANHLRLYSAEPTAPEYASKHYENDMALARIVDINLYKNGTNVLDRSEEPDGSYYHEQDILNAEVRSKQEFDGNSVTFRSWTLDDRNILITDITLDEKTDKPYKLKLTLKAPSGISQSKGTTDDMIWLARSSGSPYSSRTSTAVRVLDGTSEISGNDMIVTLEPGKTVKLASFAHSSSGLTNGSGLAVKALETVKTEATTRLKQLTVADTERAHEKHLQWWKDYWMKSYINVADTTIQRYYFGALYGLGCTVRPTAEGAEQPNVPGSMLGVWQTNDKAASYGRGYTNYNYEAPYYGLFSSNRSEIMEPYFIEADVRLSHAQNTVAKLGYRGAQFERSIVPVYNFYNKKSPITVASTKNPNKLPTDQKSNVMLYTQAFIWDWQYNQDEERLKQYTYPAIKQTVEFYMDFVEKGDDGKYWVYKSANNELNASSDYDINPILDIGYIKSHFKAFIEMSEYLGENLEMIPQMQEILDNLSPLPTSENAERAKADLTSLGFDADKEVYVSGYFSDNYDQVKASNCPWGTYIYEGNQPVALEGVVHPAENVSLASDPDELTIARDTFEYFNPMYPYYRGAGYNGFPKSFTIAARLGIDGDRILSSLDHTIQALWRENLTCRNGDAHGIESFGTIEAVNSMLLQNHEEELRIFPSWAKSTDIKFVDLRAKGAFLISSEYKADGQVIPYVDLTSEKGNTVNLVSPWKNGCIIQDGNGQNVSAQISATKNTGELLYTFETQPGSAYHITENPEPYEPVQSVQVTADETVLYTGDTLQAAAQVLPQEALVKIVKWSSSDPETAKVDQKGVITGITPGIAEITAESLISPDIKGTLTIEVKERMPDRITITDDGGGTINVNDKKKLKAEILPENTTNKTIEWSSSNPEIVGIDENGNIKGGLSGTAQITASAAADENITNTVDIKVNVESSGYSALKYYPNEASVDTGSTKSQSYTMAYGFQVKNPIVITELGFYDQNNNGKFDNTGSKAGIWTKDGTEPLAAVTLQKGTARDGNGYCYAKLDTPITLEPGEYEIAGYYPKGSTDNWFHSKDKRPFATAPQIEYLNPGYAAGTSDLVKPDLDASKFPYHCINFKYLDKNRLEEQISKAKELDEAAYGLESWIALDEALDKAEAAAKPAETAKPETSDQKLIDTAAEELQSAIANLETDQVKYGIVAEYNFLDADMPLADQSEFHNDGAMGTGNQVTEDSGFTKALEFDGTGDAAVRIADQGSLRTFRSMTIDLWVQMPEAAGLRQVLVSKKEKDGNGFKLEVLNDGTVLFVIRGAEEDNSVSSEAGAVTTGENAKWHHLKAVYDYEQGKMILMVDQDTTEAAANQITRSTINSLKAPLCLGHELEGADKDAAGTGFFKGRMARLVLTNVSNDVIPPAITAASIQNNEINVDFETAFTFHLSEDNLTLDEGAIELHKDSEPQPVKAALQGNILTVTPEYLAGGTDYTLVISGAAIHDTAGNPMRSDYIIEFMTGLEGDLNKLQEVYDKYLPKTEKEELYTEETFQVFQAEVDAAKAILDKGRATVEEVSETISGLEAAALGLLYKEVNTDVLTEKIAEAKQILLENQITEESIQKLQGAMETAEKLLGQEPGTVSPEDIQNSVDTLAEILRNLEYKAADMSALAELCTAVQNQKVQENNWADYEETSVINVEDTLRVALEVLDRTDLTVLEQGIVDLALKNLQWASDHMSLKPANTVSLRDMIRQAEAVKTEDYTEKSSAELKKTLDAARELLLTPGLTIRDQAAVDEKADALQAVLNGLTKRADMTLLTEKIRMAEACKRTDYTDESWEVFVQVLSEAETMARNSDLSEDDQQSVNEMIEKLAAALEQLERTQSEEGKTVVEITQDPEAPQVQIANSQELVNSVFTEEEKHQIADGVYSRILLTVRRVQMETDHPDMIQFQEALDGRKLGMVLDITIQKQVGDGNLELVRSLDKSLRLIVPVPEELKPGTGVNRTFTFLRLHDGQIAELKDLDQEETTITIESGSYSLYAIIFRDEVIRDDNDHQQDSQDHNGQAGSGDAAVTRADGAQTGDSAPVVPIMLILLLAGSAAAGIVYYRKRDKIHER
ncbi:discoidin domain-containing protein [Diplocloster hominis]|uniref:discoidin domain-containing protein n=1 Tax=Diplocloster hominis TaxID=3079010 RepID=UPI0031BB1754